MSVWTGGGLSAEVEHRAGSLSLSIAFTLHVQRSALFGPSGAGKSTLLRIFAGLVQPDSGQARLDGRPILSAKGAKRVHSVQPASSGIGLITQQPALFPNLSVEENIAFALQAGRLRQRDAIVREHLERFALGSLSGRRPASLSGGERQRVALVRALVRQPRMLLLDEPFGALDGDRKRETWAALDAYLNEQQMRALLVTHDAAEVWAWADEVVRIENGRIVGQGAPAAMLQAERDRVLQLFGSSGAERFSRP